MSDASVEAFILPRDPHPCPYLRGLTADYEHYLVTCCDDEAFCRLLENGFRHFGDYFFRPDCLLGKGGGRCEACVPLRVPTDQFRPSESQRRVLRKGRDVRMTFGPLAPSRQKYELYRLHKQRFAGKPRAGDHSEPESHESFLMSFYQGNTFTNECVYALGNELIGVGYLDVASRAASSIYFYFDPQYEGLSPGTLSILREIELARDRGIPYYYLGYLVYDNPSMRYKAAFLPCEVFDGQVWRALRNGRGDYLLDVTRLRTGACVPLLQSKDA